VLALGIAAIAVATGLELSSPLVTGSLLGVIGLICVLPPSRFDLRLAGAAFCVVGLGFYAYALSQRQTSATVEQLIEWTVFAILAITAVGSAIAMVASRSAVYSAIWFAMTLLTTGGLFLYQGAQFLGVATVTVYAGAIVVTFLFVIMLAQPGGHAAYDRISWGWFAKPAAGIAAALLLGGVLQAIEVLERGGLREVAMSAADELSFVDDAWPLDGAQVASARIEGQGANARLKVRLVGDARLTAEEEAEWREAIATKTQDNIPPIQVQPLTASLDPQSAHRMAHLGGYLFSRHLIAVEVAGTLLLAALVGAIAMLSQGAAVGQREGEVDV
jgi:NADH-quinone oxidoreductase subunit J